MHLISSTLATYIRQEGGGVPSISLQATHSHLIVMASLASTFHGCRHGCFLLLLLLLLLATTTTSLGSGSIHVLNVQSLLPSQSCSASPKELKDPGNTRLKIVHRHGPCSPLMDARRKPPSHAQILAADQNRVDLIHLRISASARRSPKLAPPPAPPSPRVPPISSSSIPAMSGSVLGTGNYVVTVGLGTPAKEFTVIFDTGSDVTWVQCQPCVGYCYKQRDALFDPAQSSTYANISCGSPYCSDLDMHSCLSPTCIYAVQYGDNSVTVGFYAQDTLTLSSPCDVLEEFRFGCGENNRGLFGRAAGLLGLGRGKTSLTVQAYAKYGGVFAYCLPATTSGTGYLTFGADSPTANAKFTPLLTDTPTFYFVDMTGISVGGEQLAIPQSVFATAGTIVDSGTVITRLPPDAYSALKSAFKKAMSAYKTAPAFSILDTCYDFTGVGDVSLPTIELQFSGGASLDVDVLGIVYAVSISQVCLAFAGNDDPSSTAIIGNTQQKTFNVVYDVSKKAIGFCPGAC